MAYENTSFSELMEAVRQERNPLDVDDLVFTEDEDWESVLEVPRTHIDIDQCIQQTLQTMACYRLDEKGQQTIREFLTFRLQTQQQNRNESLQTRYNLMFICEQPDTALRASQNLWEALQIRRGQVAIYTEADAIQKGQQGDSRRRTSPELIPTGTRLVLIHTCREAPIKNMDGGATLRDKSAKEVEAYHNMWKTVCDYIRRNPETILIVSGNQAAYRHSLRLNLDLSRRICSHHIHFPDVSVDELLEECLEVFRSSSLTVSPAFEQALTEYFPAAYRISDLAGQAFIEDLVCRVYARYFCRKQESDLLTAECVPDDNPKFQSAEAVLGQMNELIGLQSAKDEFSNIYKMQLAGLSEARGQYHMLFTGNPGTGKTTVARLAADLLYSMNVIRKNKLVIAKPSDMISEWIGGTGTKAMEVIRRAYHGVLFIDEAYGIATMDRGDELLNILVQEMENNSDKLVVILAGYTDEMRTLMKANPGLSSRIGRQIEFEDYSQEELAQIFLLMCQQEGFSLHPDARDELDDCIAARMTKEFFGNAREIRNMLQDLKEAWSEDYYRAITEQGAENVHLPRVFGPQHFATIMPPKKEVSIQDLIGLDKMKQKLQAFKRQAMYQKHLKEKGFSNLADFSMHMIFTGNPGTGKTTVAKLIADDLYSIGMLKTNRLVIAERKDLVGLYGDTAKKTADVIRKAVGGVLFIDEAYALADSRRGSLGHECIEVLLTAMEAHKSDTVFIFAGYVEQMQEFLAMNPGIQSRIGYTFHFEDYSPEDLTRIYAQKMRKTGFTVTPGALEKVHGIMEYFQDVKNFGNGRFVDHVIHQTISQRANRDFSKQYRNIQSQDIPAIKTLIETAPNNIQLYDPADITEEHQRRTAVHEVGHAIVMLGSSPAKIPQCISIRNHAGSFGRVMLGSAPIKQTEQELMNTLASSLGGKNAEKLFFGCHSTGCASDYQLAKCLAEDMVKLYAMTSFGKTAAEILDAADKASLQILSRHQAQLEPLCAVLMEKKELSGEEFFQLFSAQADPLQNH